MTTSTTFARRQCPRCSGTGTQPWLFWTRKCAACGGDGIHIVPIPPSSPPPGPIRRDALGWLSNTPSAAPGKKARNVTTTTDKPEFLPCPFCGLPPFEGTHHDESLWSHNVVEWQDVGCRHCGVSMSDEDLSALVNRWNRRQCKP